MAPRGSKIMSALRDLAIGMAIAAVLLVIAELALRPFLLDGPSSAPRKFVGHPVYLYGLNPDTTHRDKRADERRWITYDVNRWGFRGADFPQAKSAPRLMVYGDSNILGAFSEEQNTFAAQLAAKLRAETGETYQVINAGVDGYGPDQVALKLAEDIETWQPDVVLVQIFADNDLGDLLRNKLFRLDESGALVANATNVRRANAAEKRGRLIVTLEKLAIGQPVLWVRDWLERRQRKRQTPEEQVETGRALVAQQYRSYLDNDTIYRTMDVYDFDVAIDPDSPSAQLKAELLAQIVRHIQRTVCDRSEARLLFVIEPSSFDMTRHHGVNRELLGRLYDGYAPDNIVRAIEDALRVNGASHVNLWPSFAADGGDPFYFQTSDNHWNEVGQERAAELVADDLIEHGLLDRGVAARPGCAAIEAVADG